MNEIKMFVGYYQIGAGAASKLMAGSGRVGGSTYDVTGEDPFARWLTRVVARYAEPPLVRLWEWCLDRMPWLP